MKDLVENFRDLIEDPLEVISSIIVLIFFVFIFSVFADLAITQPYTVAGSIVGMEYTAARTSSSSVYIDGKFVTSFDVVGEKWTLILSQKDKIKSYEVPANIFYTVKVGDIVVMECKKGKIYGIVSCYDAIRK